MINTDSTWLFRSTVDNLDMAWFSIGSLIKVRSCAIFVPSATRLKMWLTSGSGCTKQFNFFLWLTKTRCEAEMKITKLYVSHFTPAHGGTFAGALCEKNSKTNGDHSRSMRSNLSSASPATMSFSMVIIVFCFSSNCAQI